MNPVNIIVLGAHGQVGKAFHHIHQQYPKFRFLFLDRKSCDISSKESIENLRTFHPNIIINCAAYTAVDLAESEIDKAKLVNTEGSRLLAAFAERQKASLIHFSTDYVYHHNPGRALKETDETNPQSIYAQTKLEGELAISEIVDKYLIFRTSWVYDQESKNFVTTMLRLAESRKSLSIVSDQIGAPTYAHDIAVAVLDYLDRKNGVIGHNEVGIYNLSNQGVTNWFEFAKAIFKAKNIDIEVKPIKTSEYPTPASRPLWSVMSSDKLNKELKISLPNWKDSLHNCLKLVVNNL